MESELNKKISCCCSLFKLETYRGLHIDALEEMIMFAHDFLSNVDIEKEIEAEMTKAGGFNVYYSIWYKSLYRIDERIGFKIRYNKDNEITNAIMSLDAEEKRKGRCIAVLGVVGIALAVCLCSVDDILNRKNIAVGRNGEINIYKDRTSLYDVLFEYENGTQKTSQSPIDEAVSYDIGAIKAIYDYCNEDVFTVGFEVFVNAVANADFARIYKDHNTVKSKCAFTISVIKNFVYSENWYREAAHSIDTEPTRCSGMKVPLKWKNGLKRIG